MNSDRLSCSDVQRLLDQGEGQRIAYLPVGCTEQHGPVLPLATDTLIAEQMARDLNAFIRDDKLVGMVYPAIAYSPSRSNVTYAGSTTVSEEVFRAYCEEVSRSILAHGFDALVFICMHGPAEPSLTEVAFKLNHEQFSRGHDLCPVVVLGVGGCAAVFQEHLGNMVGRHADFKEVVLLYATLGETFFDETRMEKLRHLARQYRAQGPSLSCILGLPMEMKSYQGVVGEPFPEGDVDLEELATKLREGILASWRDQLSNVLQEREGLCNT